MTRIKFTKKRAIATLIAIGALVVAGGAFAYFTASGSGTGQAAVGSASPWTVAFQTTTGTMYPGAGTATLPYTITNAGSGNQKLATTAASVNADVNGNVTSHGTAVTGCLASWFTAANTPPSAADLAAGAHTTGSVAVTMADANANQNACQGVTPDITVSAS
jgi:hypothetical protein